MKLEMKRLAYAITFMAWVIPRVIPLLFYPGVYSFDAWFHIGCTEAILAQNHVPFYGEYYSYLYMPFLHLFACLIHCFLGLSLIDSFRLFATILVVAGFIAFYALFRSLLGKGWPSVAAMLIFSLDVDVVAQTNAVIPENLALVFLALTLLATVALLRQSETRSEWFVVIVVFVCGLAFTHHLTTYFGILFAISLLIGSILSKNPTTRQIGMTVSMILIISMFALLLVNPTVNTHFFGYSFFVIPGLTAIVIVCVILFLKRDKVWHTLEFLKYNWAKWCFPLLSCLVSVIFLSATLIFYPYERPWLWIFLKFGLFSCLLGLGVAILRLLPWSDIHTNSFGLFVAISFLVIGVSFSFTGLLMLMDNLIGTFSVGVVIGHRHFTFLLIPLAIMSTLALYQLTQMHHKWHRVPNRLILSGITLLLLSFSLGGIYNLYAPAGGWYPEWCDQSEIGAGIWLSDYAEAQSFVTTDKRLTSMMQGMFPAGTSRFQFLQLNQSILSNPLLVRSDPRTNEHTMYFMTSDLMEAQFILEYQVYPLSMECSSFLDTANSLAKIYNGVHANTYWLVT